jgi:cytochrome c oxidase subunit 2
MGSDIPILPEQASTIAGSVDYLFVFLLIVTVLFASIIFLFIFYFAIRYRRIPGRAAVPIENNLGLELLWSLVPMGLSAVMFTWGTGLFIHNHEPPANALNIYVVGKQWMWTIEHPEGRREINELHVPVQMPVKLILASQDVIHDFFVPAFRVKQDVVPGRYTTLWFQATKTGDYRLFCAQYCGTQHSGMIGRVVVMNASDFQDWLGGNVAESPVKAGEQLFHEFNCASCHDAGPGQRGPVLAGAFGMPVHLEDGQTVVFDAAYMRESLINPNSKVVKGYRPVMPTFRGQLTEDQIVQLITYVQSLTSGEAKQR